MIDNESTFDLLLNNEAAWSMPPQAWGLLVLILLLMGWGMWLGWRDERRGDR